MLRPMVAGKWYLAYFGIALLFPFELSISGTRRDTLVSQHGRDVLYTLLFGFMGGIVATLALSLVKRRFNEQWALWDGTLLKVITLCVFLAAIAAIPFEIYDAAHPPNKYYSGQYDWADTTAYGIAVVGAAAVQCCFLLEKRHRLRKKIGRGSP